MTKSQAQTLAEESGIEPSLTDDEMREYIDYVLVESEKKTRQNIRSGMISS